jgi:hypothetical protein
VASGTEKRKVDSSILSLALLDAARESRLNAYVVLSLTVGVRTEEARELHWDHVDLDGDPSAVRPVPPTVFCQREPSGAQRVRRRSRRCIPAAETGDNGRPNGSMNSAHGPVAAGTVPSRSLMV